jgi:transposase
MDLTNAQWEVLEPLIPDPGYPPYQTCHRRFQRWNEEGVLDEILRALAEDLKEQGGLDLSECFIDGTFVSAKKGANLWERPNGARARS